jgi:hypothetical protein
MTDVTTPGQGPSVVSVSSKTNRQRRSCLRSLFCPFRRGRSRKVGLEPPRPAAASVVKSPIRMLCREDEEPSEWHMPIDWAVDVKDPPKAYVSRRILLISMHTCRVDPVSILIAEILTAANQSLEVTFSV